MKKFSAFVVCAFALLAVLAWSVMGGLIEKLQNRFNIYQQERPYVNLYVHLDKNNYLTNETIWFKAYLLSKPDTGNKVLFVRLLNKEKKVVLDQRFVMYDVRSHGDLTIPDSLNEGEYYFYAYTNQMLNYSKEQVFVQKIKIFKNAAENMQAEASVVDSTKLHRGGAVDVVVKLKKGSSYVPDAKCNYQLMVDEKILKTGRVTTNLFGEAVLSFTYPQMDDDKSLRVRARFLKNDDNLELDLNLRHEASPVIVKVYPEGGHLVAGLINHVVIETGDNKNNPVATALLLKTGDQTLTRLHTNTYGITTLNFIPDANARYTFVVPGGAFKRVIEMENTIEPAGYGLHVKKTGDQYFATITNKGMGDSVMLVLRSFENLLWGHPALVKPGDSLKIQLPMDNRPKDMMSLAVFDAKGNCAAERLFMHRGKDNFNISIKTEKENYGTRQKVKVTLTATDAQGGPIATNLSVAVAEQSRISTSYVNIMDGYYHKALSTTLPDQHYGGLGDEDMDAVLITKQWLNNWSDMLRYQPKGIIQRLKNSDGVSGQITRIISKKPIEIKDLFVMSNTGIFSVPISKDGSFSIGSADLVCAAGQKKYLLLNADFNSKYDIRIENFAADYDQGAAFTPALTFLEPYITFVKLNDKTGVNLIGPKQLKEVKIKSRSALSDHSDPADKYNKFESATCADWVCFNGIFDCKNHPYGTPPVEGQRYAYEGRTIVYHGCGAPIEATNIILKTISIPNKFILPDYDKEASYEPELRSTIYWSPNLNTDKTGVVTFEFFTSDIKGDFTVMAQGVNVKTLKPVFGIGKVVVK